MRSCPHCGVTIPSDSPHGLCTGCLLAGTAAATGDVPEAGAGGRADRGPTDPPAVETREVRGPPPPGIPSAAETVTQEAPREGVGATIGHYKLLQRIGEGGFGTVFMAEQQRPVRRRVALKVIKLGMDTRQVIARFEAERQALALMDHPNIARVFDAGATAAGRPYFVMELVRGVPITEYCDVNRLTTVQRLELFIPVCHAIQHAHQKGVIHRDVKPSNVLVTLHDGMPVPKVIDFGIAKATNSRLTELTLFTEFRQFIGTPAYVSPEQAEMSGLDIDTRSDIYSLGVLLYELLTGTTPFDPKQLGSLGYGEIQRIIREVDPPKPSTRLSTLGDRLTQLAVSRSIDPKRLGPLLHGDLDWIVMKAMEKDRTRRYETPNELARDVRRHLDDEPIEACPPGTVYRVKRFVRRHRVAVSSAAALAMVVTLSVFLYVHGVRAEQRKTTLALADARAQRTEAEQQRQLADRQRDEARKQERIATSVNDFLSNMLSSADPDKLLGDKVTVVQSIEAAEKQLDSSATLEPLTEASLRDTIGSTLLGLSRYGEAEPNLRKALSIRRALLPAGDAQLAASLDHLGRLLALVNKPEEAEKAYREALDISRKSLPAGHRTTAANLANLAGLLTSRNRMDEAESLYREVLETDRKALPPGDPAIVFSLQGLGHVLEHRLKFDEAEHLYREALAINRKTLPAGHPDLAVSLHNLAALSTAKGAYEEAEPLYREALAIDRNAFPVGHPTIASTLEGLGFLLQRRNKPEEAERLFREGLAITRKALPPGHPSIASSLCSLANFLKYHDHRAEAETMYREALAIDRKALPPGHQDLRVTLYNLAFLLVDTHRDTDAVPLFRELLQLQREDATPNTILIANLAGVLGDTLAKHGNDAEAEPLLRESIALGTKTFGPDKGWPRLAATALAQLLDRTHRPDEAKAVRATAGLAAPATRPAATRPAGTRPTSRTIKGPTA